jgi:hypothetical protein
MKIKTYLYLFYRIRYGSDKRPNDFQNKKNYNIISNEKTDVMVKQNQQEDIHDEDGLT